MHYADNQVISFTVDPTGLVVEFTQAGAEPDASWSVPLIGWAIVSQPPDTAGGVQTDLQPVVLQEEQGAVLLSRLLAAEAAGITFRIHHRT